MQLCSKKASEFHYSGHAWYKTEWDGDHTHETTIYLKSEVAAEAKWKIYALSKWNI